jgi:hypothetical protein
MENKKGIAIGVDDFQVLIDQGSYYIDKTLFIKEIVDTHSSVTLITRPRRFGKTLNMNMLKCFFEHPGCRIYDEQSNRNLAYLFENLAIWNAGEKYRKEQGAYPVVYFSLKGCKGDNWESAANSLKEVIAREYKRHRYLLDSKVMIDGDKERFINIMSYKENIQNYQYAIKHLTEYLKAYFNKPVIVLIDEYDTPIQSGYLNDYFEDVIGFMKSMLVEGLKGNPYLKKAVLTGIMKVAKESIFSDFNNPEIATLLSKRYSSYFGFTKEEVLEIATYYDLEEEVPNIKDWYDGYLFGNCVEIYNPWSILNYINDFEDGFRPYWVNTSSNEIIQDVLQLNEAESKKSIERLLNGETIKTAIDEHVVYQSITTSTHAAWSFLLHAGYLKVVLREQINKRMVYHLAIPNMEVEIIFEEMLKRYFKNDLKIAQDIEFLLNYLLNEELNKLERLIQKLYLAQVSYFDLPKEERKLNDDEQFQTIRQENFHHGFILGLLMYAVEYYEVKSNREYGSGRPDLVLIPRDKKYPAYVFELKYATTKSTDTTDSLIERAKKQIVEKKYVEGLQATYNIEHVTAIAVAFKGKDVKFEVM